MKIDFSKIDEAYLQTLICDKVLENIHLEYKDYQFPNAEFKDSSCKQALMSEIVAFANTDGGLVLLGIKEAKHFPVRLTGVGLEMKDFGKWQETFNNLIATTIKYPLNSVNSRAISLADGKIAIAINVPKSFGPHAVYTKEKCEFYMRNATGKIPMDFDTLRQRFLGQENMKTKIDAFCNSRVASIINNELEPYLGFGPKLVLHILSECNFDGEADLEKFQNLIWSSKGEELKLNDEAFNDEGYCAFKIHHSTQSVPLGAGLSLPNQKITEVSQFIQLFNNGSLEIIINDIIKNFGNSYKAFDWNSVQSYLFQKLSILTGFLNEIQLPKPWRIRAAFINAKDCTNYDSTFRKSEPLHNKPLNKKEITSVDGVFTHEAMPLEEALKPVLDSLSRALGHPKSQFIEKEMLKTSQSI